MLKNSGSPGELKASAQIGRRMASSEQIKPDEDGRFAGTDWILAPDEEGRYYYWNEVSEEISYCKPVELGGYVLPILLFLLLSFSIDLLTPSTTMQA